jgi:hypothetical protein
VGVPSGALSAASKAGPPLRRRLWANRGGDRSQPPHRDLGRKCAITLDQSLPEARQRNTATALTPGGCQRDRLAKGGFEAIDQEPRTAIAHPQITGCLGEGARISNGLQQINLSGPYYAQIEAANKTKNATLVDSLAIAHGQSIGLGGVSRQQDRMQDSPSFCAGRRVAPLCLRLAAPCDKSLTRA